jgi:uncharacterized protein YprB with RNaseH-like and TPR domain
VIDGTFSFVRGIGPARERQLLAARIRSWDEFPAEGVVLSPAIDESIRTEVVEMKRLLATRQWERIAARLPVREHWRFLPVLYDDLTFLDIETTADGIVTVIGLYDERRGPRSFVRGHNLGDFVQENATALVTFNGGPFDLPVLRRTFPGWRPPLHVDLRVVFRQLREGGGLKALEERLGIGRPPHLRGVGGLDAVTLWGTFRRNRDPRALQRLLEYNLYDAIQLRPLVEIACERLSRRRGRPWKPARRFLRGDILFDLSRVVDAIVEDAGRIEPDQFHDEERKTLRAGWG